MRFSSVLMLAISAVYAAKNDENWIESFDDANCNGGAVEGRWNKHNYDFGEGARSFRLNLKASTRKNDYYFGHPYACDYQSTMAQYPRGHPIWSLEIYNSYQNTADWPKPEVVHQFDAKHSEDRRCFVTHNGRWNDYLRCLRLRHF